MSSLLSWIRSFGGLSKAPAAITDLADSIAVQEVLYQLDSNAVVLPASPAALCDTWTSIIRRVASIYHTRFHYGESVSAVVEYFSFKISAEQLAKGVEPSLAFLVRLVLGAVLVSQGRLAFVAKLQKTLNEKDLAEIASIADSIVQSFGDSSSQTSVTQAALIGASEGEAKLHAVVDALSMDKARLEHELLALTQTHSAVTTERDSLRNVSEKLEGLVREKHDQLTAVETELTTLRTRYNELSTRALLDFNNPYEEANERLRSELATKEEQLLQLKRQVEELSQHALTTRQLRERLDSLEAAGQRCEGLELKVKAYEFELLNYDKLKGHSKRLEEENEALLRAKIALEDVANTIVPKLQKKIEKYKQQLVDLTTRESRVPGALTEREQRIASLNAAVSERDALMATLRQKLEELNIDNSERAKLIDEMAKETASRVGEAFTPEMKERMVRLETENEKLVGVFASNGPSNAAMEELDDEIDIQRRALAKLQQEVASHKKKIVLLEQTVQTLESDNTVLGGERDSLDQRVKNLTREKEGLQIKLKTLNEEFDRQTTKLNDLEAEMQIAIQKQSEEIARQTRRLSDANAEIDRLSQQLKNTEGELVALGRKHNEESLRLEGRLAEKSAEAETLLEQLRLKTLSSEESLANVRKELEQTKFDLERRLTDKSEQQLKTTVTRFTVENQDLTEKLQKASEENARFRKSEASLREQNTQQNKVIEDLKEQLQRVGGDRDVDSAKLKDTAAKLAEKETAFTQLEQAFQNLTKDLQSSSQRLSSSMDEGKQLRTELRALRERVDQSESRSERLNKERVEAEGKKDVEIREEVARALRQAQIASVAEVHNAQAQLAESHRSHAESLAKLTLKNETLNNTIMRLGMEKRTLEAQMTDAMIERKKLEEKYNLERLAMEAAMSAAREEERLKAAESFSAKARELQEAHAQKEKDLLAEREKIEAECNEKIYAVEREQKLITSAFYNLGVDIAKGTVKTQPQNYDEDDEEEELAFTVPAKPSEKENSRAQAARRVVPAAAPASTAPTQKNVSTRGESAPRNTGLTPMKKPPSSSSLNMAPAAAATSAAAANAARPSLRAQAVATRQPAAPKK